jgi:hypothetical protein
MVEAADRLSRLRSGATLPAAGRNGAFGETIVREERRHLERELDGATWESLLTTAPAASATADKIAWFRRCRALLLLDDAAVSRALEAVRDPSLPQATRILLIHALGAAGSAAAQEALEALIRTPPAPEFAEAAMTAASFLAAPGTAMRTLMRELASAGDPRALLATGQFVARSDDPELGQFLREREGAAESVEEKETWLHAVGNARGAGSVARLAEYCRHEEASLRAAAAYALRFVDDPAADELLIGRLDRDASAEVRIAATDAMFHRSGPAIRERMNRASRDGDEEIRKRALRYFAARSSEPDSLDVVRRMAQEDSSASVREEAARVLAGAAGE